MRFTLLSLSAVALVISSCSSTPPLTETFVEKSGETKFATINSYVDGKDFLAITALDGVEVPKSLSYQVTPGRRKLFMATKYKDVTIDHLQYHVRVKAGESYTLIPERGEVTQESLPGGVIRYDYSNFIPRFVEDSTGKQLYPQTN